MPPSIRCSRLTRAIAELLGQLPQENFGLTMARKERRKWASISGKCKRYWQRLSWRNSRQNRFMDELIVKETNGERIEDWNTSTQPCTARQLKRVQLGLIYSGLLCTQRHHVLVQEKEGSKTKETWKARDTFFRLDKSANRVGAQEKLLRMHLENIKSPKSCNQWPANDLIGHPAAKPIMNQLSVWFLTSAISDDFPCDVAQSVRTHYACA